MESYERHNPWNKRKLVGQKAPLRPKDIWAIRIRLKTYQNEDSQSARSKSRWNFASSSLRASSSPNRSAPDFAKANNPSSVGKWAALRRRSSFRN